MAAEVIVNILELNADFKKFAEEVDIEILNALKSGVHSLVQKLGDRTPKDTERTTANWNTSIGSPDHTELPLGKYPGSPERIARQAQAVLNGMTKPEVVWLSNPLNHISILNDGHSQQAAAGFIELAIAETEAEFR